MGGDDSAGPGGGGELRLCAIRGAAGDKQR